MSDPSFNNILVVDDDEFIMGLVEEILLEQGYRVFTAGDYDAAWRALHQHDIQLILADVYLRERTGIELLQALRAAGIDCPVVMITSSPELSHAAEAVRLGAADYLLKPMERERLLHVTRTALDQYRLRVEHQSMQARLEAVFHSVQDGIITVDGALRVRAANPAARRLCRLAALDDAGRPFEAVAEACDGHCVQLLRRVVDGEVGEERQAQECVVDGESRLYTLSAAPLRGGDGAGIGTGAGAGSSAGLGAVLVVRDETRLRSLEAALSERRQFHRLVGRSAPMREIYALIEKLGETPVPVLINGETGTGKELVAEALHRQWCGEDEQTPFIRVNCAALSDELLESELFGHVKGAFTGALRDRPGRFELAHGGTIFLDEIGDISPKMQSRLLRVLQEREVERVGGNRAIQVDFQLVVATNRDLRALVAQGSFREDLFHRLNVVNLHLPPLRERSEDIPLLVEHFLERLSVRFGRSVTPIAPAAQRRLLRYPWPGNVRELEHAMEHALVFCDGTLITEGDLPAGLGAGPAAVAGDGAPTADGGSPKPLGDQRGRLLAALEANRWNKSRTAKSLGIDRRTLYRRMARFGIEL